MAKEPKVLGFPTNNAGSVSGGLSKTPADAPGGRACSRSSPSSITPSRSQRTLGDKLQRLIAAEPAAAELLEALVARARDMPLEDMPMKRSSTAGWQASTARFGWANPRPPAAPVHLHLTLDEYFAAAALMGLLASQGDEPDKEWVAEWSQQMGRQLARRFRPTKETKKRR